MTTCFFSACNNPKGGVEKDTLADATADTAVMYQDKNGQVAADGAEVKEWGDVDFDAPTISLPGFNDADVEVRGNDTYNIYAMDEKVLFDLDKATLRPGAEDKLRDIANSIKSLGNSGAIRIYGYTDSLASKSYNKELSEDRANTVKDWLQNNTDIDASRMSIQPMGEKNPVATNETAAGRQENRRVAIVVAKNPNG